MSKPDTSNTELGPIATGCLYVTVLVVVGAIGMRLLESETFGVLGGILLLSVFATFVIQIWKFVRDAHIGAVNAAMESVKSEQRKTDEEPDRKRKSIPDKVKIFVWQRDEGKCVKCGSHENLEFDHIIPRSKGGSNTARNLQLLCERCNKAKGPRLA